MALVVVDASVATKWLFEEPGSAEAARLRAPSYDLVAPDLMTLEVANVIWKRIRQGELTGDAGRLALRALRVVPVRMRRTQTLVDAAWEIALRCNRTVYDSLYLALAMVLGAPLVTADRRFYDVVARNGLGEHMIWIEELGAG